MALWIAWGGIFALLCVGLTHFMLLRRRAAMEHEGSVMMDAPLSAADLAGHLRTAASGATPQGVRRLKLLPGLQKKLAALAGALQETPAEDLLPALKWLRDNARMLEDDLITLAGQLKGLPALPADEKGEVIIRRFCREMLSHANGQFSSELFIRSLMAWQSAASMTLCERWALPLGLQSVLLNYIISQGQRLLLSQKQRDEGARLAKALCGRGRNRAQKKLMSRLSSTALWERLIACLKEAEAPQAAAWLEECLAQFDLDPEQLVTLEHRRQAEDQLWMANAITSLRAIGRISWPEMLETLDPIDGMLREDRVYAAMDAESRAYYRSRVQRLARLMKKEEQALSRTVIALSHRGEEDGVHDHVGFYLLEPAGEAALAKALSVRRLPWRVNAFCRRQAPGLYRVALFIGVVLGIAVSTLMDLPLLMFFPLGFLFSQLTRFLLASAFERLLPVRRLPRLYIEKLSPQQQTLVVCPTLLTDAGQAMAMARQLSILHHANPDPRLHFMLLGDFSDSLTREQVADQEIIAAAKAGIAALNETLPTTFFYLQRGRSFNPRQQKYIGRERKRGSLAALNRLLTGQEAREDFIFTSLPPQALAHQYAYVITLDSDTLLPPGSAYRLIGALAHPLQKRRRLGGRMRGVSVIAPRMATSATTVKTRISALWGGTGGIDPYNAAQSNVYQDLCGRGSFCGKGIYTPDTFLEETEPFIPADTVLSHDLLEGELAGCALASDIVLYDGNPATLGAWMKRLHRWTRGDWQLLPWLFPTPPGTAQPNPLDAFSRHKIWDNLRRSLLPVCQMLLLIYAAGTRRPLLFLLGLFLTCPQVIFHPHPRGWLNWLICLACLPYQLYTQLDAIGRTLWRMAVSRKHLLDWVTAAQAERGQSKAFPPGIISQWVWAGVLLAASLFPAPASWYGAVAAGLFSLFPLCVPWLDGAAYPKETLPPLEEDQLTRLARETWQYFDSTVTLRDNYLPPDNLQFDPDVGLAHRTSPTNIGFYLLSLVCAQALGFIEADDMARRMALTVSTLERLAKWKGHLFNWYDTRSLSPLPPAYISAVDSGNLCACLLLCAQALRTLAPQMDSALLSLGSRMDALAQNMELGALFDPASQLFFVGYDCDAHQFTASHYDLLASEARLLSFTAVMTRQAPLRHWFRMGRTLGRTPGGPCLLSWSGTMFEYLMPHLLLPLIPGTLLHRACLDAVRCQARHSLRNAWGVSESGYYAFDPHLNYQYKAFGLPALALGNEAGDQVITPYASALAASLAPRLAAGNLNRMSVMGWACPTGMYEAIDFDASRLSKGESFHIVRSQMAHHQGMILCALTNALKDQLLPRYWMALPAAQAYGLLLEERMSRAIPRRLVPLSLSSRRASCPPEGAFSREGTPFTLPVDGHLIHGGGTTLFTDALGNGYMARDGLMLTRFTGLAGEKCGIQFYLREGAAQRLWQPTDPTLPGEVRFSSGQAVYQRSLDGVETTLSCCINPLDGAVLHLLEITNTHKTERMLDVASYFTVALIAQEADNAHPAFRELFVETAQHSPRTLWARRRPRKEGDDTRLMIHTLSCDAEVLQYAPQTDREAFIGRNGGLSWPEAMTRPIQACDSLVGAPIHPCLSLRCQVMLPAKGHIRLLFSTVLAQEGQLSPAGVEERYGHPRKALRFQELSVTQSLAAARHLTLSAAQQRAISRMSARVLLSGQKPGTQGSPLSREGLWRLGISGDLPLWALNVTQAQRLSLLRQALKAHRLYRLQGVLTDLALIVEPHALEAAQRILESLVPASERSVHGGVHLLSRQDLPQDVLKTLEAFSRLILDDRLGSLEEQLSQAEKPWHMAPPLVDFEETAPRLPKLERAFFNGLGGFAMPEADYVIDLPPGARTPAPWCNMLSAPHFGTLVCESGPLFTYRGSSHHGRLTPWPNDPVSPQGWEGFLLYDVETGMAVSPTPVPMGSLLACRVTYSPGVAEYQALGFGLEQTLTIFTDPDSPVSLRLWRIKNTGKGPRQLRLSHYARFILGASPADEPSVALYSREGFIQAASPHFEGLACLGLVQGEAQLAAMTPAEFEGLAGDLPNGLLHPQLSSWQGTVGIVSHSLRLEAGQSAQTAFVLAAPPSQEDWEAQLSLLRSQGVSARLRQCRSSWERELSLLSFHLPEEDLQLMMNRWLPYQVRTARLYARAGFYQAGGAIGFRDQLQDMLCLMHTDPQRVREHLLLCAAHQFEEGDVQHWWHPPRHGVRTRISDDLLFLPYVTAWYVNATQDESILEETISYLTAPPLAPGQEDRYDTPEVTAYTEPLRAHCLRAIRHVALGSHGLPLMKGGDWNDGMNRVGGQRGESVWLGFFFAAVLKSFAPYAGEDEQALLRLSHQVILAADTHAWDGEWYLRAFYDNGEPLGSRQGSACRIDNLSQSWAVLAGAPKDRAAQALDQAYQRLFYPDLGVMQLLDPPFSPPDRPGYIAGYLPGIRENGGQYTHAVPWVVWAMAELGWTERAWQVTRALLPVNHALTLKAAHRYRVEPYVMAGDIYINPQQRGRGGWSFYTGSAAWLYTVVLEKLLGFQRRGDQVRLSPQVPEDWKEFSLTYRWGGATYHLTASREEPFASLDGEKLPDGWVTLLDDGRIHQARFRLGS